MQLNIANYSIWVQFFSARGHPGGAAPSNVNLGPCNISETTTARKLKLKMPLDIVMYLPRVQLFFARGRPGSAGPPNVILGPLISRKLLELES